MIDPLSVLIATPTIDGKIECSQGGTLLSIGAAHLVGNIVYVPGNSSISTARDAIANRFYQESQFEWLVWLDADIEFCENDFRLLMNYPPYDGESPPTAASVNDKGEPLIVCAEYARKMDKVDAIHFGLGFCRVHKSVYEKMAAQEDGEGNRLLDRYMYQDKEWVRYHPELVTMQSQKLNEDHGFFWMARNCGITPCVEQRTRLIHTGRKQFPYTEQHIKTVGQNAHLSRKQLKKET